MAKVVKIVSSKEECTTVYITDENKHYPFFYEGCFDEVVRARVAKIESGHMYGEWAASSTAKTTEFEDSTTTIL